MLRRADMHDARARQGLPAEDRRIHLRSACCAASPPSLTETRPAGIDADGIAARVQRAARPQAGGRCRGRRHSAAAAELLHRLPGAAGVRRHQADAARDRADAYQRRHRLPFVRDLRAVLARQLDPRLRHVARERRRGRPEPGERRPIAVMGDGGFWHNGLITGVASNLFNKGDGVLIVMQNGYASATGQQYLPSSKASRSGAPTGMDIEQTLRSLGVKWLRTVRTYSVAEDGHDPEGGDAHRRARPQGDHRRRRMHAGAPAPRARRGCRKAQARRARGEDALRRRRRDLHRRSFLHPAVRLSVADRQAQSRSAAHRSGRDRDRKLRRLRAVRRGRARGGAVPVVLSRRRRQQSELVGPRAAWHAARRDWVARRPANIPSPEGRSCQARACSISRRCRLQPMPRACADASQRRAVQARRAR